MKIRSKKEIAERAIALAIVCFKSEGEEEFAEKFINDFGANDFFTPKEKEFIKNADPDQQELEDFNWQYECCWVLLWALGFVEELEYPDSLCEASMVGITMTATGGYENFFYDSNVRSAEDILDQADLIYRYHWACTDCRINELETPSGINEEVIMERHRALNWLINYEDQEWDDVTMDT